MRDEIRLLKLARPPRPGLTPQGADTDLGHGSYGSRSSTSDPEVPESEPTPTEEDGAASLGVIDAGNELRGRKSSAFRLSR
jgi:hypothetical protein